MVTKAKPSKDKPEDEIDSEAQLFYTAEELNPALLQMYAELGITGDPDTTVHVAKVDANGKGDDANVWKGDPEQYDLESLAKKFGSGAYRVMVYVKIESGQKVRKVNKVLHWMLSPEDEQKRLTALNPPAPVIAPQQDILGVVAAMMAAMTENTNKLIAAMQKPESDPLKTLEGVKAIAALVTPPRQPDTFGDALKMMDTVMGLRDKFAPPEKLVSDDGEVSLPNLFMMALKEFKSMRTGQTATPEVSNKTPDNVVALPVNSNEPPLTEEEQELNIVMNFYLKAANKAASLNENPAEYAETIYSVIPEDILKMICTEDSWFSQLVKAAPACAQYEVWYRSVGEKLKALMIEDKLLTPDGKLVETGPIQTSTGNNGDNNAGTGATAKT